MDPGSAQDPWQREDSWQQSQARTTEGKKLCTEDPRERDPSERIGTAVATAHASMTTMAGGLQLSAEAGAIVAAIHGATTSRLDQIQGQMTPMLDQLQGQIGILAGQMPNLQTDVGCLKTDVGSLMSEVGQLGDKVQRQDQRMTEVEREIKELKAGRRAGTGAASSPASSEVIR